METRVELLIDAVHNTIDVSKAKKKQQKKRLALATLSHTCARKLTLAGNAQKPAEIKRREMTRS